MAPPLLLPSYLVLRKVSLDSSWSGIFSRICLVTSSAGLVGVFTLGKGGFRLVGDFGGLSYMVGDLGGLSCLI